MVPIRIFHYAVNLIVTLFIRKQKNYSDKCGVTVTICGKEMVTDKQKWLLVIVEEATFVEGLTRLHKYAFMIAKRVKGITNLGFYKDWKSSNFGPFSPSLASDIDQMIQSHLLEEKTKPNEYGYNMGILIPTESSKGITTELRATHDKYVNEIRKIIKIYQDKKLIDILHDVYYLYPEYATKSKIRAEVGKKIYESDSFLNPNYD
jgi:hypothetical protein